MNFLLWRLWDVWHFYAGTMGDIKTKLRFKSSFLQKPNPLPGPLILSLTSCPPRFKVLHKTLKSLLVQSVKPDRVILWIAPADMSALPRNVLELRGRGLEIREAKDTGPFKKLIPALQAFPEAFIVTADDDVYYQPGWLETLLTGWNGDHKHIVSRRGTYAALNTDGTAIPCTEWPIHEPRNSGDKFVPTGGGGTLYTPGCFHKEVFNEEKFMILCARNDDIWFFWMARMGGAYHTRTPEKWVMINWPFSQKSGLWHKNIVGQETDEAIKKMIECYGWPGDL
jgi:hypothetical protein